MATNFGTKIAINGFLQEITWQPAVWYYGTWYGMETALGRYTFHRTYFLI